jgi:hypothetical protein
MRCGLARGNRAGRYSVAGWCRGDHSSYASYFPDGETTELTVLTADGEVRTKNVTVARPNGKKLPPC